MLYTHCHLCHPHTNKQLSITHDYFSPIKGIGDSGQGFFNALIFCLLNAKVRSAYLKCFKKACRTWKCDKIEMKSSLVVNRDKIDTDQNSTQE